MNKAYLMIPLLIVGVLYVGIFNTEDYIPWIFGVGFGVLLIIIGMELDSESKSSKKVEGKE